jgi:hypothetical protein
MQGFCAGEFDPGVWNNENATIRLRTNACGFISHLAIFWR